jgi:hypothetical protein
MGLFNLKFGKLKVPLYDIGTLAAGFYIGYNEGKGIDVTPTVEYLTKYGPTAFAVTATPIMIKLTNAFEKWMNRTVAQNLQNGNLEVTLPDGSKRTYRNLDENQRQEITSKVVEGINNLESKLQDPKYLKPTLSTGARTAVETTIGYFAGRLYCQIN